MDGPSLIGALNAWGAARDQELVELRANLSSTQVSVAAAFDQAKAALHAIVCDFRLEAETMRQQQANEAALSVGRLERVVEEARLMFGTQDARLADGLSALAQRQQAIESWALAEPARMAAISQPPAPAGSAWVHVSPGGSFYPPGLPGRRQQPTPPQQQQPAQQTTPPQTPLQQSAQPLWTPLQP